LGGIWLCQPNKYENVLTNICKLPMCHLPLVISQGITYIHEYIKTKKQTRNEAVINVNRNRFIIVAEFFLEETHIVKEEPKTGLTDKHAAATTTYQYR